MPRNVISEAEAKRLAKRRPGETESQWVERTGRLIEKYTVSRRGPGGSTSVRLRKAKPRSKPKRKKEFRDLGMYFN